MLLSCRKKVHYALMWWILFVPLICKRICLLLKELSGMRNYWSTGKELLITCLYVPPKIYAETYETYESLNFMEVKLMTDHLKSTFDLRGRPQSRPVVITIITPVVRPSVCQSQNFKIEPKSLSAGTVGWPNGSLMTPVFFQFCSLSYLQSLVTCKEQRRNFKNQIYVVSQSSRFLQKEAFSIYRAVLVVSKRNVAKKFKTYTQVWQILI